MLHRWLFTFAGYDEVDRFFPLLCELILKKQSLKTSGESESECKPQLNQCVLTPRGQLQKFSFEFSKSDGQSKTVIPNIPQYLCCPISNTTNGLHSEENCVKIPCLSKTSVKSPHFHSQDCAQEDSGIETSDSCDEKKEPCHRTLKRPHSQILNSSTMNNFS